MSKFLEPLKLQLFAEGVQPPQQTEPQVVPQPTPTPQNQPQLNINELVSNISNKINETLNQRLSPIEQKLNQPAPLSKEQIDEQNESIRQQFENDPMTFVKNIQEQAKKQAMDELQPSIQKFEQLNNKMTWKDTVGQFLQQNPDAQNNMTQISQVLQENPGLMSTKNPLDAAYKIAVSSNLIGSGGNVVQGVLGNEEYKKQIMQDPTLREQIIQEYQASLNNGTSKGLPPIMGNNQGGSIPASGGETPKNLKEARMSALRRYQQ